MTDRVSLLRWAGRDLRKRWPQVVAIAVVIGIGSGVYSGLSSTSAWRRSSYDTSYAQLEMYDLRVAFSDEVTVDAAQLEALADGLGPVVSEARVRLRTPTQVDASGGGRTVLVPGELVGTGDAGPNTLEVRSGREPRRSGASSDGPPDNPDGLAEVAIDEHFAEVHGIEVPATIRVGGDQPVRVVGRVISPEFFMILGRDGGLLAEANHAVVFAPQATVAELSGGTGTANDLLVDLAPDVSVDRVAEQLGDEVAEAFPNAPATVMTAEDDPVRTLMYDDIAGDQRFFSIFAVLVLLGASFAAFNLTGRVLEAQRREFGIGLALGTPLPRLAARPLLLGAGVALLGAVAGVVIGLGVQAAMGALLKGLLPLPTWSTELQPLVYLRGAALGFVLPLVASVLPLRRTVGMAPVDAIRTSHRTPTGGYARWLVKLPGSTLTQLPLRNVLRAPRRTMLTALGLAAAVAVMVGVMGLIDSFLATIDRGETDLVGDAPDRLQVELDFFHPVDGGVVAAVSDPSTLRDAEPGLRLPGKLGTGPDAIDVLVQTTDFSSGLWRPRVRSGALEEGRRGVAISTKAAHDLQVDVGGEVLLEHPVREGLGYRFETSSVPVLAVHDNPYRFFVYVDDDQADLFGLEGIANTVTGLPPGSVEDAQRALFTQEGVRSVLPVSSAARSLRDQLESRIGVFDVVQVLVLLMTVLIAFNSTTINVDERAREHATSFAFGLPLRRVVGGAVLESAATGVIGVVLGLVVGRALIGWMVAVLIPRTFPDLDVTATVAGSTVVTAMVLGMGSVAVAPLFTAPRLARMNLPATLRVVE